MRLLLFISLLFISLSAWGQAKRAENLIEKEKYEQAFEILVSGMQKDSTDASLPFVLSELYLTSNWKQQNLDSAFYFAVNAIEKYNLLDEKSLDKHIKDGFGKTRLVELKEHIDHLSFERAKEGGKEESYQQFIDQHTDATDLDSAIFLRNEQAFLKASLINTRSSYKYFLDNYPNANDWREVDARYQKILYIEKTNSGKLKEYLSFIDSYPASPYYEDAVRKIYAIEAGKNTTEVLLGFVDNYPTTKVAQKAIGLLYHKHLESETATSFADKYPRLQISDSLKQIIAFQEETLIPTWGESFIQFIDLNQNVVIDSLESIEHLVGTTDFISAKKNGQQVLLNKLGQAFYKGKWQQANELGNGSIALLLNDKVIIVHKNGTHFTVGSHSQLLGPFIGFEKNDKWGLVSITGITIADAKYDSIWFKNGLIFLEQEEKISPNLPSAFYPALDGYSYKPGPFYEDYEWLGDSLLWVADNNKEGLLSNTLNFLVPFQKQQIDLAGKGWTITQKNKIQNPVFSSLTFSSFKENKQWQIGVSKDTLLVRYTYATTFSPDSAFLLGPSSIEMRWEDSTFVYLTDSIRLYKPKDGTIRPLLDQMNEAAFYERTIDKKLTLFNDTGHQLDLPSYEEISPLSDTYFLFKGKRTYDLYNKWGEKLLEDLDGAALVNDSTVSIFKDQKFGLYATKDSIYWEPAFEKKPVLLADSLWLISADDMFGVISSHNHEVVSPNYDAIEYWANGLLFLKKDLKWNIYDIKTNSFPETGIIKYHSLLNSIEPTIIYQKGVGTGIFGSENGIVLRPTYSSVSKKGTKAQSYYLADKYVEEALLHVLLYYDLSGKLLFKKVISDKLFEALFGERE